MHQRLHELLLLSILVEGSFYFKTVIACNPPSQIFFILGYMKAIKK